MSEIVNIGSRDASQGGQVDNVSTPSDQGKRGWTSCPPCPPRLPNIPPEFWKARKVHQQIRQAAHSRLVSADLVLHGVLAKIAAMRSPELVFDSGRGRSCANYFAAPVGASGTGKSTGAAVVDELVTVPAYLSPEATGEPMPFSDSLPMGSGEGVAEAFMGVRECEGVSKNGEPIVQKRRCKVRDNVFITLDEGETFTKINDRKGSTNGPAIRSAWMGTVIGQNNGREDTTRIVPAGSYSLGMLVGFQPATALPLLQDTATGTAQRFAWVSAVDPTIPDEPVEWPGPLTFPALVDEEDDEPSPRKGVMSFPEEVKSTLRADHLAKVRGEVIVPECDSQGPLMRCKLAVLLALLDRRFDKVTDEDWRLAGILWETSCAVRDAVTDAAQQEKARDAEAIAQAKVQLAERTAAATAGVDAKLARLATVLAEKVLENGHLMRAAARRTLRSDERGLFDPVVERAVAMGLLRVSEGGGLYPPGPGRIPA
ncbi:MAG: hypothetical protein J2P27_01060 [Actinobacteria bacterium]|nr:hypothetical protein [Actinomycetota bacterium]